MVRGSKWFFLLIAAYSIQVGLLSMIDGAPPEIMCFVAALIFILGAASSLFWLHLLLMVTWAALVVLDLVHRQNPFAIFFVAVAFYQVYHFLRSIPNKSGPPSPPQQAPA